MKDVLKCYAHVLASAGVPWVFKHDLDYNRLHQMRTEKKPMPDIRFGDFASTVSSSDDMDVVMPEDAELFWRFAVSAISNARLFWRLVYKECCRRNLIPSLSGCNLHNLGQETQYKVLHAHMVRVKVAGNRKWYRHVKDLVVMNITPRHTTRLHDPLHAQFD